MDEEELRKALRESFDPDPAVLDDVVEKAMELDRSGKWSEVSDTTLTPEFIAGKLETGDRPLDASWNWWMGMVNYLEEGFRRFQLRK